MARGPASFILDLFGIRTITQGFITYDDEPYIELDPAFFVVTADPLNRRNIVSGVASPTLTDITVESITLAGQPGPLISGPYSHVTTNATPYTLKSFVVAAASTLDVEIKCIAVLGTGPNANSQQAVYRLPAVGKRAGSASAIAGLGSDTSDIGAPFVQAQNSGSPGPGSINVLASGNSLLVQVVGFAIKEAWTVGHGYLAGDNATVPGDFVTSNGGVWVCTTGGTATGSAPTGTGTAQGTGAIFDYVGPASGSSVTVSWTLIVTGLVGGA